MTFKTKWDDWVPSSPKISKTSEMGSDKTDKTSFSKKNEQVENHEKVLSVLSGHAEGLPKKNIDWISSITGEVDSLKNDLSKYGPNNLWPKNLVEKFLKTRRNSFAFDPLIFYSRSEIKSMLSTTSKLGKNEAKQ